MKKENDSQNRSRNRQLVLLKLVAKELKETRNDYVDLLLAELRNNPLLSDFNNVKISLERIKKDSNKNFDYSIITHGVIGSVLDHDLKNLPQAPYRIRIVIENLDKLSKQIVELEKKSEKEENTYTFTLTKDNELYLEGSKLPPYKMERGAQRLKLLSYLANEKKFVKTVDLSKLFGVEIQSIRKTVGEIRTEVSKKLKVPRSSIVKNSSSAGYKVDNVKLK